jgi:hypothetical protein
MISKILALSRSSVPRRFERNDGKRYAPRGPVAAALQFLLDTPQD